MLKDPEGNGVHRCDPSCSHVRGMIVQTWEGSEGNGISSDPRQSLLGLGGGRGDL